MIPDRACSLELDLPHPSHTKGGYDAGKVVLLIIIVDHHIVLEPIVFLLIYSH